MSFFSEKFNKKETKFRRNYSIEDKLYKRLEELSKVYEASVVDLINASIEYLIKTEKVELFTKDPNDIVITHTVMIRESNINGLEKLKDKYEISIYKLVNIAIRAAIQDEEQNQ